MKVSEIHPITGSQFRHYVEIPSTIDAKTNNSKTGFHRKIYMIPKEGIRQPKLHITASRTGFQFPRRGPILEGMHSPGGFPMLMNEIACLKYKHFDTVSVLFQHAHSGSGGWA